MSTEELNVDFNWDDVESPNIENMETGDSDESTRGKVLFARYRYFHIPVEWAKGTPGFPLPGVFLDRYQEGGPSLREGPYFVKGAQPKGGSKSFVNVIVAEATNRDGSTYQRVDQFTSFDEVWHKAQWPALKQLSQDNLSKLQSTGQNAINLARQKKTAEQINADASTWVYGRSTLIKSDIVGKKQDGSPRATYYRNEFAFFANAQEWTKARDAFFAQFADGTNGATPALDLTNIPAGWLTGDAAKYESGVASMFKETVRQVGLLGMKSGAIKVKILNAEGQPNVNQQGQPIDAVALLAKILDTPEPMIDLS